MNLSEQVNEACKQPTLLDALTYICVEECERAINQAKFNCGSGANNTCFKRCLEEVMNKYSEQYKKRVINIETEFWEAIKQTARESDWIPEQYYMNDWVNDICNLLRTGKGIK